jgi:hypothetical protein
MGFPNIPGVASSHYGELADYWYFEDFVQSNAHLASTLLSVGQFSTVANRGQWLLTCDVVGTIAPTDNSPGGAITITTGGNVDDFMSLQLNGEQFRCRNSKDIYFATRVQFGDSDDTRWFAGLATTDTTGTTVGPILDGVTASIGFRQNTDTGQDIYALVENASTETEVDTGINVADATYVDLAFWVHERKHVTFYVNGGQKTIITTNIPDDASGDAMTPSFEVHSPTASSTMIIDYVLCGGNR